MPNDNTNTNGEGTNGTENTNPNSENGTGQNGEGNNNGDGTNAAGTGAGNNQGGSENSNTGNGANSEGSGFEGEFEPARAKQLIDRLREENKALRKAKEPVSTTEPKEEGKEDPGTLALERIQNLERQMQEANKRSQFKEVGTALGLRPESIPFAFDSMKDDLDVNDSGVITNLTSVIESLKARASFMFVPVTNGQAAGGSSGASTSGGNSGTLLNADEEAARKAFSMTTEQWEKAKSKVAVKENRG